MSQYYPETMLKMFLVNTPRVFPAIWKVVQPMIDPVSAAKISILGNLSNDGAARQELLRHHGSQVEGEDIGDDREDELVLLQFGGKLGEVLNVTEVVRVLHDNTAILLCFGPWEF